MPRSVRMDSKSNVFIPTKVYIRYCTFMRASRTNIFFYKNFPDKSFILFKFFRNNNKNKMLKKYFSYLKKKIIKQKSYNKLLKC